MHRILFIGESWMVHTQETKGFDVFTYDYYEENVDYIRAAVTAKGDAEFVHIPSHRLELDFPQSLEELSRYDVVMVSDCGANTFNLPMSTFLRLQRSVNKLELIREYVAAGGAFVMIGGYLTFQGIQARGAWKNTPVEEILPVELLPGDDRMERCQGVVPTMRMKDHPVLAGLADREWPAILGYNKLLPKPQAQVIATVGEDPFVALMDYGKGRTCAFATDCAPHWAPIEFCTWDGYSLFWGNLIRWLTRA